MNRLNLLNCFKGIPTAPAAGTSTSASTSAAAGPSTSTSAAAGSSTSQGRSIPAAAGTSTRVAAGTSTSTATAAGTSTRVAAGTSTAAGTSARTSTRVAAGTSTAAGTSISAAGSSTSAGHSDPTDTERAKGPSGSEQLSLDVWYSHTCKGREFTVSAPAFTFRELQDATNFFNHKGILGRGTFGRVFKGYLRKTKQEVAVKRLDPSRGQGIQEFVAEVMTLDRAIHPNIIKMIGYCAENNERLLVYEYMPLGCLKSHLIDPKPDIQPLDWNTRMHIIDGVARGLEHLHHKLNPCIIYRDLKCSNILLDQGYHVKLSDFGLAKEGKLFNRLRVVGSDGYTAPEYEYMQTVTVKSDVYSFGVVLLELITGRRAFDKTKSPEEQRLVDWVKPLLENEDNFPRLVDPSLGDQYSREGLRRALSIASSCIHDDQDERPTISQVIMNVNILFVHSPIP